MLNFARSYRILLAVAIAFLASDPAAAQERAPRPFHVAVPEGYLAFDSTAARPPEASDIALIVFWNDPATGEEDLILLNPRYATPEALHLGLMQLEAVARHGATDGRRPFPATSVVEVPPRVRGQLAGILARVREAEPEYLPGARQSRFARLDALPAYLRTATIPTRGNPEGRP
jgi:hypothetical protein